METASTDLVVSQAHAPARPARASNELWAEPLDTPGVIPHHLTRSAAASSPLLEILQRILYRLRPTGTGDLERALALLALYQAIRPAYGFLRDMLLWACTVQITVQESDPAAKEVSTV
jgi:chaperone BCS1